MLKALIGGEAQARIELEHSFKQIDEALVLHRLESLINWMLFLAPASADDVLEVFFRFLLGDKGEVRLIELRNIFDYVLELVVGIDDVFVLAWR